MCGAYFPLQLDTTSTPSENSSCNLRKSVRALARRKKNMIRLARVLSLALLPLLACSGAGKSELGGNTTAPTPHDPEHGEPVALDTAAHPTTSLENSPPDFEIPAWKKAGVGQEIGFGLEVLDEDQDRLRVELVKAPPSASYDPQTLTVVWKPTKADKPAGLFQVRITETARRGGAARVFHHEFQIGVLDKKQEPPTAQALSAAVEQLITIHDVDRLAEANKAWPIDKLLAHGATINAKFETKKKLAKANGAALYRDMLVGLAKANHNPRVDPSSPTFDRKSFGDPKSWKLIAVRPRIDKKWHEVRLVYKADKAHAATYAMFKFRPSAGNAPAEAREDNNRIFSGMVFEHFFTKEGELNPLHTKSKKAHAKAVAAFVSDVLSHPGDGKNSHTGSAFLGLPLEARLGGGSKMSTDGTYDSGDGWGWNVQKVKYDDAGVPHMKNVPIKGFATAVVAKESKWAMSCAGVFGSGILKGLCRDSGHVDLPGMGDGHDEHDSSSAEVVSSKVDAANLFLDYKDKLMVNGLPLRDPRRDLFEEKGMTCSQCHVRKFGVRDMYDASAYDASAGAPSTLNKRQAATFFVITPTVSWQPYAIDFQHKQQCKFKTNLQHDLGREVNLTCPLKAD